MKRLALATLGLVALAALPGCRTALKPLVRPPAKVVYVGDKSCEVYDFAAATDVPEGATSLGWVSVKKAETDDDTFVKLREKICAMGGDALSTPAWVLQAGEYEPTHLKANAWSLP
ncbi:MAG: hypothetical protein ACYC8T_35960 [Myxococcaceae bacterium]